MKKISLTWADEFRFICSKSSNSDEVISRFWDYIKQKETEINDDLNKKIKQELKEQKLKTISLKNLFKSLEITELFKEK